MTAQPFELEIFAPGRADVLLESAEDDVPWAVVEQCDLAGIRVVGEMPHGAPDASRRRALLEGCAGLLTTSDAGGELEIPALNVSTHTRAQVDEFLAAVLKAGHRIRPYAFMVGRLERDFLHARDAIRTAVEVEAGIPCLWADDGRYRIGVESVRERTRLLIKHATFVIADLTLGVESPKRENPSRAHEIGMAIAYERPLMLCSQEPRRYPYFSIGDMQMSFWSTEDELEKDVTSWIRFNAKSVARRVFNYRLPSPRIAKPVFTYDPRLRYVGPRTPVSFDLRRLLARFT